MARPVRLSRECQRGGPACRGELTTCPNCRFIYCETHGNHISGLTVPPDAWKGVYLKMARNLEQSTNTKRVRLYVKAEDDRPMTVYAINGNVVDARPPARIEFCEVPSSGRVDSPCGHQSKPCTGETHTCEWCRFTYCDRHIVFHVRRIVVPRELWQITAKRLETAMDAVRNRERENVWVRLPRTTPLRAPGAK